MTSAIAKLQRILGLKNCGKLIEECIVQRATNCIITHMEHHSNQTSW